jgi:DNA replication factor GINS
MSLENIEVGDFKIESLRDGESVELPRWVVEELTRLNLAEIAEEPFETELYRSLSREKVLGPFQLSSLAPDFYMMMRRRLAHLKIAAGDGRVRKEDYEKVRTSSYDLVGVRLGKLLTISSSSTSLSAIAEKLTPEERTFFSLSQSFAREWKNALLRDEV